MEIGKQTKIKITVETLISMFITVFLVVGMYYSLKAEIKEAKELPNITELQFTIMQTQKDINKMCKAIERIEDKLYE